MIWGWVNSVWLASCHLCTLSGSLHQPLNQQQFSAHPCSVAFPLKDCLALPLAVTSTEINASLNIVFVAEHRGVVYGVPGHPLLSEFMFYLETLPRWYPWRLKEMRFSFVEQICSQFMMYFMMPSLGAVTYNSVSCTVPLLDAGFPPFVLLELISERGLCLCVTFIAHEPEVMS